MLISKFCSGVENQLSLKNQIYGIFTHFYNICQFRTSRVRSQTRKLIPNKDISDHLLARNISVQAIDTNPQSNQDSFHNHYYSEQSQHQNSELEAPNTEERLMSAEMVAERILGKPTIDTSGAPYSIGMWCRCGSRWPVATDAHCPTAH